MTRGDSRRDFIKGALAAGIVSEGNLVALGSDNPAAASTATRPQPRIMYYTDGRHPLTYMYEPPMQKEECEAAVDHRGIDVLPARRTPHATRYESR